MPYELALKLKKAGFPQDNPKGIFVDKETMISEYEGKETVKIPTLSELIEACGEDFIELEKIDKDWWCKGAWEKCGEGECPKYDVKGPTPEEAVSMLWLELNKK